MKINRVSVEISVLANKGRTYLYNEMNDLTKKYHFGGTFGRDYIELKDMPEEALKELKETGIKFMRIG